MTQKDYQLTVRHIDTGRIVLQCLLSDFWPLVMLGPWMDEKLKANVAFGPIGDKQTELEPLETGGSGTNDHYPVGSEIKRKDIDLLWAIGERVRNCRNGIIQGTIGPRQAAEIMDSIIDSIRRGGG